MNLGYYTADQHPGKDRSIGITRYTEDLLRELNAIEGLDLMPIGSRSSLQFPGGKIREHTFPCRTDHLPGRVLIDNFHPWLLPDGSVDLIHYPKGYLPLLRKRNVPLVTTIHDTIVDHYYRNYRKTRSSLAWQYWLAKTRDSIRHSDAILTISETARRQIVEFSERSGIKVPPIHVTFEGSRMERFHRDPSPPEPKGDYVIVLSSAAPHKGVAPLLALWQKWVKGRNDAPDLLLVGNLPVHLHPEILKGNRIRVLPFQSDAELVKLIRRARGMIVPSEIEGFGLPVLEAFYLGTPAIALRGTSCHELLGFREQAAFALEDSESFEASMGWLLDCGGGEIESISRALYERFNWSSVARETLSAYQTILTGSPLREPSAG